MALTSRRSFCAYRGYSLCSLVHLQLDVLICTGTTFLHIWEHSELLYFFLYNNNNKGHKWELAILVHQRFFFKDRNKYFWPYKNIIIGFSIGNNLIFRFAILFGDKVCPSGNIPISLSHAIHFWGNVLCK